MKQVRQSWIDYAKGVAIFLVVLGHSGPSYLYTTLYYIHLPIFLIISGYLLGYSDGWKTKSDKENLAKKAAEIMFPYYIFGVIYIVAALTRSIISGTAIWRIYEQIKVVLILENTSNWFLPPLFLSEILFMVLHRYFSGRKKLLVVAISGAIIMVVMARFGISPCRKRF